MIIFYFCLWVYICFFFLVKAFCRCISDLCDITVANPFILFFVIGLTTVMLYNSCQSIYFIFGKFQGGVLLPFYALISKMPPTPVSRGGVCFSPVPPKNNVWVPHSQGAPSNFKTKCSLRDLFALRFHTFRIRGHP